MTTFYMVDTLAGLLAGMSPFAISIAITPPNTPQLQSVILTIHSNQPRGRHLAPNGHTEVAALIKYCKRY